MEKEAVRTYRVLETEDREGGEKGTGNFQPEGFAEEKSILAAGALRSDSAAL